jgi:hypothetical protein
MAITSKYDGKCKDCGTEYLAGDSIDTNGNKSKNKNGEIKDHWCKFGKECPSANMQLQGDNSMTGPISKPKELTGEELKATFLENNKDYSPNIAWGEQNTKKVIANYIGCKIECERNNIKEGPVIGMIFKELMENERRNGLQHGE